MLKKALLAIIIVFMLILALVVPVNSLAYKPQFKIRKFNEYLLVIPDYLELEGFVKLPSRGYASLNIGGLEGLKVNFLDNVRYMFKYVKPQPTTTLTDVLKDIGVTTVREKYGLTGEGVTVGIVDTGVDFSIPSLGLDKVARDESGKPLLLDTDMLGFTITDFNVEEVNGVLQVKDREFYVYFPLGYVGKIKLHRNWIAPPVKSVSGKYKFGLFVQVALQTNLWLDAELSVAYFAPVVLVDSKEPGVYDTVFVDVSTTWYILKNFLFAIGYLEYPANPALYDFSFKDEKPLKYGDELAYIDENGDGYPEFSIGVIAGYVYDVFGLIGKEKPIYRIIEERAWEPAGTGIYPGLDPKGRYVDFFYDPIGHGTSVASIIAGKKVNYLMFYYKSGVKYLRIIKTEGIAPEAKIAAATGLYVGSVITAEMWLSGHNYVYPWNWTYTGKPRVDIISNSWGLVEWDILNAYGIKRFAPGKDPISKYEDYISSLGVLVVHAAGNSGPGYGTVLIGGSSSKAVTVGATTIFQREVRTWDYGLLFPKGLKDEVVSWSSRGPILKESLKPNIVAPGAYTIVPLPALGGVGNGIHAVDVFGGTSMSTPIVSGSVALIIEKLRKEGKPYTIENIKKTLYLSADDLGYDPLSQGWGKLNVSKALEYLSSGITVNPVEALLTSKNNYTETISIEGLRVLNLHVESLKLINSTLIGKVNVTENYNYIEIPLTVEADYLEIYINHSLYGINEYLNEGDYTIGNLAIAVLGLWNDTDGDGEVDMGSGEFALINHAFSSSNILRLTTTIDNVRKYGEKLVVGVRSITSTPLGEVNVYAKYFKWEKVDYINASLTYINPYVKEAKVKILANKDILGNGVYEAKLKVIGADEETLVIPVLVFASENVNESKHVVVTYETREPMENNVMYEGMGWISGASRGDWRTYRLILNEKYEGAVVETLFKGQNSNVKLLAFNNSGVFVGGIISAQYPIIGVLGSDAPPLITKENKLVFALGVNGKILITISPTLTESPTFVSMAVYPIDANIFYYRGDEAVLTIYSKYPLGIVEVSVISEDGRVRRINVLDHKGGLYVKKVFIEPGEEFLLTLHEIPNVVYAGIAYNVKYTPILRYSEIPFETLSYSKYYSFIKTINSSYN